MNLDPGRLRGLLTASLPESTDRAAEPPSPAELFTPNGHRDALDPDVTLVRGGRGVGKTFWYLALQEEGLRYLAARQYRLSALERLAVHPGYGTALRPLDYPGPAAIAGLLDSFDPLILWQAVCLHALDPDPPVAAPDWHALVAQLVAEPTRFETRLAAADAGAGEATHLIVFDALDRLNADRGRTDALVAGLLQVALELRTRTRRIRAKVFARPDLLPATLAFADASKLTANAVELRWSPTNLYGLLFTLVANAEHPDAPELRAGSGDWTDIASNVWRNPELAGDSERQRRLWNQLASTNMGANARRGRSYEWLPAHLADGLRQTSPRSFLAAVRKAAEHTAGERSAFDLALHWEAIREGVQEASKIRVAEISEDISWMPGVFEPLRGLRVPAPLDELVGRWSPVREREATAPDSNEPPRVGPRTSGGEALVGELVQLGVMTRRADGRVDIPDVYRVAFGISRKGGIPRVPE